MRYAAEAPEGGSDTDAVQPPKRAVAGPADPGGVALRRSYGKGTARGDAMLFAKRSKAWR